MLARRSELKDRVASCDRRLEAMSVWDLQAEELLAQLATGTLGSGSREGKRLCSALRRCRKSVTRPSVASRMPNRRSCGSGDLLT